MPTPQREPLRAITLAEQATLQRILSASSERVDQVRRATSVLAVAQVSPFIHAARLAGLRNGTTVADLVMRFNRHGLAALDIAAGRGRKPMATTAELSGAQQGSGRITPQAPDEAGRAPDTPDSFA